MAPIPEWIHAVLHHQQVVASDASFAEKAMLRRKGNRSSRRGTHPCPLYGVVLAGSYRQPRPSKLRVPREPIRARAAIVEHRECEETRPKLLRSAYLTAGQANVDAEMIAIRRIQPVQSWIIAHATVSRSKHISRSLDLSALD
ncbi:hypothetical protein PEBR_09389 [Penicillium brasilianum]|uniref:Uncharacterized protein n=1 Tax=Penicillium brasilianum TaxID=104259 RepID=A0A1S9S3G5_PENBI|nr:hypothetical protein PEBR_09389 [Penicillium brasilianum]